MARPPLTLSPEDRRTLERWVRSPSSEQRVVRRSRIILLLADGHSHRDVAARMGISRTTVAMWAERARADGVQTVLHDRPGRGRPKGREAATVAAILGATRTPPGEPRWTARRLGAHVGVSHSTVLRVWREHGISAASGT